MLDLGFRTHDFGRKFDNADQIGEIVSSYRKNACLHFAPYKVLDNAPKPMNDKCMSFKREALQPSAKRSTFCGNCSAMSCAIMPPCEMPIMQARSTPIADIASAVSKAISSIRYDSPKFFLRSNK